MASELSKFIDDELARANIEGGQETESLIKERKREALRMELLNKPKRQQPYCNSRTILTALAVFGIVLLAGVVITGKSGPIDENEEDDDGLSGKNVGLFGDGDYDYGYGGYDYGDEGYDYGDEGYDYGSDYYGDIDDSSKEPPPPKARSPPSPPPRSHPRHPSFPSTAPPAQSKDVGKGGLKSGDATGTGSTNPASSSDKTPVGTSTVQANQTSPAGIKTTVPTPSESNKTSQPSVPRPSSTSSGSSP